MSKIYYQMSVFFICFLIISNVVYGAYPVDSIAENMKLYKNAVIRTQQALIKVISPSNFTLQVKKAITVLNKDGDYYNYLQVPYDKFSHVNYIKGQTYNADGELIRFIKPTDIQDYSDNTGGTFFSDSRVKIASFFTTSYPYTIEYEYEISFKSAIYIPDWEFINDQSVSVELSGIQIIVPENLILNYRTNNDVIKADSVTIKDKKVYTWVARNLTMDKRESYSGRQNNETPTVKLNLSEFEIDGFYCKSDSWEAFGKWIAEMCHGRNHLPQETISEIKQMTKNLKTNEDKIKEIYQYLQSTTRYVSVQLGVGGFRPIPAKDVAQSGYGDCKALVNYTKAMLEVIGIESYYTLVNAGDNAGALIEDMPGNQFNHIILCVPVENDTIWLECTSQTNPFNYLGSFTDNRKVLIIKDYAGKIVKTPSYEKTSNSSGNSILNIAYNGSVKATFSYLFSGLDFEQTEYLLHSGYEDQKEWMYENFTEKDVDIESIDIKPIAGKIPQSDFLMKATIKNYATKQGKRLIFSPLFSKWSFPVPYYNEKRNKPVIVENQVNDTDTITFKLPKEYAPEILPESTELKSEFGSYNYTLKYDESKHQLISVRKLYIPKGEYKAVKYLKFRKFLLDIANNDKQFVVFRLRGV